MCVCMVCVSGMYLVSRDRQTTHVLLELVERLEPNMQLSGPVELCKVGYQVFGLVQRLPQRFLQIPATGLWQAHGNHREHSHAQSSASWAS
jgi:hypothetical protein